jgi:predicted acylesterase/phospholipase RssA
LKKDYRYVILIAQKFISSAKIIMRIKLILSLFILTSIIGCSDIDQAFGLERPRIGVALSGGSVLGFAHVGALEVIDSLRIPVDCIAGTSMGGIVGGLYATGRSAADIEKLALDVRWEQLFSDQPSRDVLPYFQRKKTGRYQLSFQLKGFVPTIPSGIITGQNISMMLTGLTYTYDDMESFDHLPVPFRCVAVDLITGDEVVLDNGSLAKAMRATMSIPSIFTPVSYNNYLLIDGGVLNNFPVDVAKEMGADIVIGLNLGFPEKTRSDYDNLLEVLDRTSEIPGMERRRENIELADIYIEEDVTGYSVTDFDRDRIKGIIQRGSDAARANIDKLIELRDMLAQFEEPLPDSATEDDSLRLVDDVIVIGDSKILSRNIKNMLGVKPGDIYRPDSVAAHLAEIQSGDLFERFVYSVHPVTENSVRIHIEYARKSKPRILETIIHGNHKIDDHFIRNILGIKPGDHFDLRKVERGINTLYGLGHFDLVEYRVLPVSIDDIKLILNVEERTMRRMYVGMRYDDFRKLVGLIALDLTSVGFAGTRLFTEFQFAGLTRFSSRLSYPSRSLDLSVYPYISLEGHDLSVNIYDTTGGKAAQYRDRSWTVSAGFGITLSRFSSLDLDYNEEFMDVAADIAARTIVDAFPEWDDRLRKFDISLDVDMLDDVLLPRKGISLQAESELSWKDLASDATYASIDTKADFYRTFKRRHTLRFYGTYKQGWREFPPYKWFFVGGPDMFVGFNYTQWYGSSFKAVGLEYRYEHKKDIFFKAIVNGAFDYNLGSPDESKGGEPLLGFGLGVKFTSILGPIELIWALGDKNMYDPGKKRSLFYFTAGMKF